MLRTALSPRPCGTRNVVLRTRARQGVPLTPAASKASTPACSMSAHGIGRDRAAFTFGHQFCMAWQKRARLATPRAAAEEAFVSSSGADGEEIIDMDDVDVLNAYFGIPGMVHFSEGEGGLLRLFLKHPYNESATEIYLHGACVTQWLRPDGTDGLALRPDANYNGEAAIESGIKLCFPQYREGSMPEDGFANKLPWQVVAAGLDFFPIPDGFNIRHPDDENLEEVTNALREAEAEAGGPEALVAAQERSANERAEAADSGEVAPDDSHADTDTEEEEEEEEDDDLPESMHEFVPPESEMDEATRLFKTYLDSGLDPAPYVTLRLADSDATRQHWPHAFELLYKITLMEDDDIDSLTPGPDMGTFSTHSSGQQISNAIAAKQELQDAVEEDGVSVEQDPLQAAAGLQERPELQPNLVEEDEEHSVSVSDSRQADDEPTPMQLRLQLLLINKDPPGSQPMTYQVAELAHFATRDQARHGDFIKVRGLGGANAFDYSEDERNPRLTLVDEDYIHFRGQRVDATFVNAAQATVAVCPGDAAHFELMPRKGFKDMVAFHPGILDGGSRAASDAARFWAAVGTGSVSIPQELPAGESWFGEFVVRFHDRYWKEPVWGPSGMHPITGIPPEQLEQEDDGDGEELTGDENYGGVGGLGEDDDASSVA